MQPVGYNSYATLTNVYYGEDTRDYGTPDENGYVAVKPVYEGATEVTNAKDFKSGKITYLLQQGVKGDLLEYDGEGNPVYGEAEQVWYQTIGEQDWPSLSGKIVYYDETNDVYTNGNEEETPESAVVSVDYDKPILGGFNQYYFKIDGRPSKLQIAHSDGSTYTFNRYSTISVNGSRGVVSIESYDKDGNEVDSLSRLVAYEVWTINLNLSEDDYTVKAKFEDEWEKGTTDFSISYDLTHGDVSVTEVKNTDIGYTFKLNGTAQKLRVVAADGATRTYNRNNANVTIKAYDANGDEVAVGSENVSYEIWTIAAKLSSGNYTAIAKFYNSGAYYWSENEFAFEV